MEEKDLIQLIESNFMELTPGEMTGQSRLDQLSIWNSFNILLLLTAVEEQFGVVLTWINIRDAVTVHDLHQVIVKAKNHAG